MTILGIDPGVERTGYGVIKSIRGEIIYTDSGCITTKRGERLSKRLKVLYDDIRKVIAEHKPKVVAVEELFFSRNVKTAIAVGQARGIVLLAAAEKNLPVIAYTPTSVKLSVGGYGRADKLQMQRMVKELLKLDFTPKPDDVADALAIALTHAAQKKTNYS